MAGAGGNNPAPNQLATLFMVIFTIVFFGLGAFQFAVGLGLRKLLPWARIAGIVMGCLSLLGFPAGTLIGGYFLYLLLSAKGQYVFSPEYSRVIAATPHIKYQTSIIVWIFLGLLILVVSVGVIALMTF